MNIIIEKDYEQLSKTTMQLLLAHMYKPKKVHLAITAGSTPIRMYELLTEELKQKNTSPFKNITYYNFDEIPFKGEDRPGVTISNLDKYFFTPAGIPKEQIHALDYSNYKKHDEYLESIGGLDAILLGLGADGHFCGNLPGTTTFTDKTVEVPLDSRPDMREILLGEVDGDATKIPDGYITMGPRSVMNVREVIMFASGKKKAEIVREAFFGPVTEDVPSSVFQLHPNFTLILDEEAASCIQNLI